MAIERVQTPRGSLRGRKDEDLEVDSSSNRRRGQKKRKAIINRQIAGLFDFVNPFPWMSEPEAMVQLELMERYVPFSWRYFDGESANLALLMPDFAPEFTLREYKIVILIIGEFFGTLPSIIDVNALAQTLLEADGWKVVALTEREIRQGVSKVFEDKLPELSNPSYRGGQRPNPFGVPTFMASRRAQLAGQGIERSVFRQDPEKQRNQGGDQTDAGRKRFRRGPSGDAPKRRFVRRAEGDG